MNNVKLVDTTRIHPVLTKREYFAGLAMQGLISANIKFMHGNIPIPVAASVAELSAEYADALIKKLEK